MNRPPLARLAAASALLALLTACGSTTTPTAVRATAADATALPTQDVVSHLKADPALAAQLPEAVRSRGTLLLGTTQAVGSSSLPHGGQDPSGKEVGLDIDLREAVAKLLGVRWDVQYGTFPTVIPGVQNGKYDVGQDNFGVTKAREQVVDFATYLEDGQSFLGAKDLDLASVATLADLCGHTVATSPGTTFQQILTQGAALCAAAGKKPYTVQYFAETAPIFLGLANGKVDIYFGPTLSLKYDAAHLPGTKYLGQLSSTPVGFVTAKGSPVGKALAAAVNKLIADGDYDRIFAKWGVAGTGVKQSLLNPPAAL
ncbi:ABC transporter substrate-binding protein [Kitasatospora sp. MMS16-BH015]|uniref:ABC transporter substrate-binding protein n=1 Tax=Kitasatospora sp. MMS16-BH015 TaxID=2018025 RepID=UPI000CA35086|nr:ABC transporter substrate-binding protein [Kitasatospora sp. MMS16-BH015]AUG80092.1 ABC transporter substrate-binding protein [Kitasatospora sp. MMS16-BH015]